MGIVKRQSLQNTIISYLGLTIGYLNFIWLFPNYFAPEHFGLIQLLVAISEILSQFSLIGINSTIIKFFPFFKDKEKKHHGILFFSFIVALIGMLIVSGLFIVFKPMILESFAKDSTLIADYYIYIFPLTFFLLFYEVLNAYSRALLKSVVPNFITEILRKAYVFIIILIFSLGQISLGSFLQLFVIGYALLPLGITLYLMYIKQFDLKPRMSPELKSKIGEMMKYGSYALLGTSAAILVGKVDIIMVAGKVGLDYTAYYSVAFLIGVTIHIPARAIAITSIPLISNAWKNNNLGDINSLYKKSAMNQMIIGILLFTLVWTNVDSIMDILPDKYAGAKFVILYIGLSKLIDMACGLNGGIIMTSKYYRFIFFVNALLVGLTIATNIIFINQFGFVGAAIATMITIVVFNFMKLVFLKIKFDLNPFTLQTFKGILIFGVVLVIGYLVPEQPDIIMDILIRSAAIGIAFLILLLTLRPSPEIQDIFRGFVNRFSGKR
ncbi:MAG: oligosaccharide flippase family protein [Bacteroidetes bacterium]|nr:oligosaccharide flippase family protein [Bacteroidota bacterium]